MAVKKIGTLNKHENPSTNENEFDIEDYMNANWDKIKEVVDNNADELSETQANKVDKVDGKGLSTEDYTTAEKQKLAGLNNYDDTEIKEDIQDIKSEQATQNTKLQELEDNQIHITTERASNLNVQDASGQNAKINIFGISKQEGTPSPKSPSEIENTTGNVKITSCNKNMWNDENWDIRETVDGKNVLKFSGYYISGTGVKIGTPLTFTNKFKKGTTYTVSGKFKKSTLKNQLCIMYKDFSIQYGSNFDDNFTESSVSITTSAEKEVLYMFLDTGSSSYNGYVEEKSLQIEENSIKTDYIENEQQTITFPLSQNQKMYDSDYLASDGIHHKRKQIKLDGTETVIDSGYNETTHHFTIRPTDKVFGQMEILSNMFVNSTEATKVYSVVGNNSNTNITFKMPLEYATVDSFKTFLAQQKQAGTPVIVEYPLSEEEVEAYTEEQQTQRDQLQNAKTYKTVTNVFTDNAEVEMNYIADTKTYIDNKYNSLAQQILEIVGGN